MTQRPVVCLTGASGGIGLATAAAFLRDGWRTALVVRTDDARARLRKALTDLPDDAAVYVADVSRVDRIEAVVAAVADRFGRLDALVNNAGVEGVGSLAEVSESGFAHVMDVNLRAAVFFSKYAVELMRPRRAGVIVNVASQAGLVGEAFNSIYCASKFAMIGFTQSIALELAGSGIRVNSVCPGPVATELLERAIEKFARYRDEPPAATRARISGSVPLGGVCGPEDVAGVIRFLCGPQAGAVTGASVAVTGGAVLH